MLINRQIFKPKRYSSGELKLVKTDLDKYIIDQKVEILFENKLSIFELLLILDYYKSKDIKIDLILSYLPYQRMDHKDSHLVNTLSNVANIFNLLDLNTLTICEPHCDIEDFERANALSYVENIKDKVFKLSGFDTEKDFVVLTDKGGLKRYGNIAKNTVYFNKQRDPYTGLIVRQEIVGNLKDCKKVLIVDDIISTGDTIINIVDYLKKLNIKEIYIMSGHLENNKYNKRLEHIDEIKTIYSTNSLKKKGNKKIHLFDVKEIIYGKENYWQLDWMD